MGGIECNQNFGGARISPFSVCGGAIFSAIVSAPPPPHTAVSASAVIVSRQGYERAFERFHSRFEGRLRVRSIWMREPFSGTTKVITFEPSQNSPFMTFPLCTDVALACDLPEGISVKPRYLTAGDRRSVSSHRDCQNCRQKVRLRRVKIERVVGFPSGGLL